MTTKEQDRATALRMFAEPCYGKGDRMHAGNCQHCSLRGEGLQGTADGKGLEPNYSGWHRLYVQAGRTIPARFSCAFVDALNLETATNLPYVDALIEDIKYFGAQIEGTSV